MKMQDKTNPLVQKSQSSFTSTHERLKFLRKKRKSKSMFIFIIIILIFLCQYIFKENLFTFSIMVSNKMNSFYQNKKYLIDLIKYLSEIKFIICIMFIVYFECPITKSHSFLLIIIFSWYISSVTDIFYGKYRGWNKENLMIYFTNGSEKPSGHCIMATSIYLSLWDIITTDIDYHKKYSRKLNKNFFKYSLLVFIFFFINILMFSQVLEKNHSFNMCIVGILIGALFYNLFFRYMSLHLIEPNKFMKYFRKKSTSLMILFSYIVGLIILFAVYFSFVRKIYFVVPNSKIHNDIILFNNESLENGLCIFILIGVYFGIEHLETFSSKKYPNRENDINSFNEVSILKKIPILIIILFFSFPLILLLSIDNTSSPFGIVILLKFCLPYITLGYSFYGIGLSTNIKFELCNPHIYERRKESFELNEFNEDYDNDADDDEDYSANDIQNRENNQINKLDEELIYVPKI